MDTITYYLKLKDFNKTKFKDLVKKYNIQDSEIAFICYYNKNIKDVCPEKWNLVNKKSDLKYSTLELMLYKLFLLKNGYISMPLNYLLGILAGFVLLNKLDKKTKNVIKTPIITQKAKSMPNPTKKESQLSLEIVQEHINALETYYSRKLLQ